MKKILNISKAKYNLELSNNSRNIKGKTMNIISNNNLSHAKNNQLITQIINNKNNIKICAKNNFNKYRKIFKFIIICFIAILLINKYPTHKNIKIYQLSLFIEAFQLLQSVNIYISTHKDFKNNLISPIYKILCDEKSQLKQKYNLAIIETNKSNILYQKKIAYCETSKMYYIWNLYKEGILNSKYVGFMHYRRIFSFEDNIPNLDEIFKNHDVILQKRDAFPFNSRKQYSNGHISHFLNDSVEIIQEKFPEYY